MRASITATKGLFILVSIASFLVSSWRGFAQGGIIPGIPYPVPKATPPAPSVSQDQEGFSVAASHRFIVIGRPGREVLKGGSSIEAAGQVIVWELEDGFLKRSSLIDALDPVAGAFFGGAVGAGDNWVAVAQGVSRISVSGASAGTKTSRVQMIEFLPNGDWRAGQDIIPSGPDAALANAANQFGEQLAMQGSQLIVSSAAGPVIYDLDNSGVWERSERINAPASAGASSGFGTRVALSGNLLLIGAPSFPNQAIDGYQKQQGRVYLYRRGANGYYALETDFIAPDGVAEDHFGKALSIEQQEDAEVVAIAAPDKDVRFSPSNLQPNYGAVYLFRRNLPNGAWHFEQQLTNFFNTTASPQLRAGDGVAIRGRRLAVLSGPEQRDGVEFFYRFDDGTWHSSGKSSLGGGYGMALVGFEYGFVNGAPFNNNSRNGEWVWRTMDPYLPFLNQPAGPFVAGDNVSNRRGDADPDGDGIKNSDEFYFGRNPLIPETNGILQPTVGGSPAQLKIRWDEAFNTYGLKSRVSYSTNLLSGPWETNNVQIVTLTNLPGSTNKRYEARLPLGNRSNVYFRLTVE